MSSINFDNPYLLLIAIPLIVLFTVPFLIAVRKDNRNGHNVTSQVLHVVMALLIGFAAAGTKITTVLTETDVYVVADVSYSANKNLDKVDNYIKQIELPRNSEIGLVCFGKDYELVSELGRQRDIKSVREANVDDSETNIAEALEYAGTLFKGNSIKRIVLITDGRQTDQVDTYAVNRAVAALQASDIKVDAIFLDDNIDENTNEVQISGAEFTASAYKSHEESVDVIIESTYDARYATERLYIKKGEQDELLKEQSVSLSPGSNIVSFDLDTSEAGTFDYKVEVEADGDTNGFNNTYSFTQTVSSDMNILLLTGNWQSMKKIVDRYKNVANIDVYENCADNDYQSDKEAYKNSMENPVTGDGENPPATKVTVNLSSNGVVKIPVDIEKLCTYDVFILNEVDLSEYTSNYNERWEGHSSFLDGLEVAVNSFGKTLITIGDLNVQGANRVPDEQGNSVSELQKLDDMLPVKFGKDDSKPDLYTIVIDVSTSLRYGERFKLAKQVASKALDVLDDNNEVCIIAFNGTAEMVQAPIRLGARSEGEKSKGRDAAKAVVDKLEIGTGTVITGGLESALAQIQGRNKNYNRKQILLITDGVSKESEDLVAQKLDDLYNLSIVTSVAWLGPQLINNGADSDSTYEVNVEQNRAMWERLTSNHGHGAFSNYSEDVFKDEIDDVEFGDMVNEQLSFIIEGENSVNVSNKTDEVLKGIYKKSENTAIPSIAGFVVSYAKLNATTVLDVQYEKNGFERESPLYAYWKYGNGKTASFTSTVAGDWIAGWNAETRADSGSGGTSASLLDKFLGNLFDTSTPAEKTDYPYTFNVIQEESSTSIQVIPSLAVNATRASARIKITMPSGEVYDQALAFDGYNYFYEFLSTEIGRYDIEVTYTHDDANFVAKAAINVSYASEYNDFATFDPSVLFKSVAANGRGTVSTDGTLKLENKDNEVGTYTVDLSALLLIICVVLYIVDIVIRKLKWEDVVSFFGGFKKNNNLKAGGEKK